MDGVEWYGSEGVDFAGRSVRLVEFSPLDLIEALYTKP
jgi:hypothetical protein